jgi:isopenicillin-N epimerase
MISCHKTLSYFNKQFSSYIHKWDIYAESQPLRFYDREVLPLLADIIRMLAKELIKCEPNELVLVENCTYAFNSILNSMVLTRGNKVFIFSTTYGIYKKLLRVKCEQSNAHLIEQNVEFPIRDRESLLNIFVSNLTTLIENDSEIKYIMVDHIPSNIPFVLPVKEMADLCKKMRPDIVFIVDAAHSLGSVNINIRDEFSNVDLLFANCHKWLCGPKGTAIFYKNKNCPVRITPAVQSHGLSDSFVSEFSWSGLRHYTSFLGNC